MYLTKLELNGRNRLVQYELSNDLTPKKWTVSKS